MKVCMLAYATYFTDARIKAYVKTLAVNGISSDVIALKEKGKGGKGVIENGEIFYLMKKYQGGNSLQYIANYLVFFIVAFFKLSFLYFRKKYKIIHVHNMPNFLVFAAIIPKLLGAKLILDVHDIMTANYMVKFSINDANWIIKILKIEQKISASFVDYIICADHMQRELLIKYGIPERKINVIMNVPNEEIFRPVKQNKSKAKDFNIVYHGTIAKRLGIDILLKAIELIKDKIPVRMNIYGEGDFLNEVLNLSKELNLEDCVYFSKSFFPVEKIPEIVGEMDVGVVPNRKNIATDHYMMPVKLMEYVYLQIPVVAPRLQVITHYFDESMIKFYQPEDIEDLARCFFELYHDKKERMSLVNNANKFIEKYNWTSQALGYLNIIHT